MTTIEYRRAKGRERSKRYYARIKALTGYTHPERDGKSRKVVCTHGCVCQELTTGGVCGFCKAGLCV
jgi:hypothetical protein